LGESGNYAKLLKLKEVNPDLKIMLSLGGWSHGSKPFQTLTSNVYRMNNFVYGAVEFLRENELDGLDVDWEYPKYANTYGDA
jgi:chitinase